MGRPQHEINAEIELHRPEREARVRRIQLTAAVCEDVAKRMVEGEDACAPVEIAMDISSAGIATRIKWLREGCDPESDHSLEPPAVDISSEAVVRQHVGFESESARLRSYAGELRFLGRHTIADMLEALAADRDAERASAISFHEEANRLRDSLARANADRDRLNSENDALVKDMADLAGRAADATARTDEAADEREATIARHRTFIRSARGIVQAHASEHPKHIWGGHEQDPMGAHMWLAAESAEVGTNRDGGDPKVEKRT